MSDAHKKSTAENIFARLPNKPNNFNDGMTEFSLLAFEGGELTQLNLSDVLRKKSSSATKRKKRKPKASPEDEKSSGLPPLPPMCVAPPTPPSKLEDAMEMVLEKDIMFYLKLKHSPSDLHYHPYNFM